MRSTSFYTSDTHCGKTSFTEESLRYNPEQFEDILPGSFLGEHHNYKLKTVLGVGGMGQAWLAEEIEGGNVIRNVVCKVLPDEIRNSKEAMKEVKRIFSLTNELSHSNICPLFGMKKDPKFGWFLVMAYIDGISLHEWFNTQYNHEKGIPLNVVLEIARPIALALDHMHAQRVIHRDIKPQNIMLRKDGTFSDLRIIDFGIAAKLHSDETRSTTTHSSSCSGTPRYMSPEQYCGKPQNGTTGQYSFATMLYELLCGHVPFQSKDIEELAGEILQDSPAPLPNVPYHVNAALMKALSKNPAKRFRTCSDFLEALSHSGTMKKIRLQYILRAVCLIFLTLLFFIKSSVFLMLWLSVFASAAGIDSMKIEKTPVLEETVRAGKSAPELEDAATGTEADAEAGTGTEEDAEDEEDEEKIRTAVKIPSAEKRTAAADAPASP